MGAANRENLEVPEMDVIARQPEYLGQSTFDSAVKGCATSTHGSHSYATSSLRRRFARLSRSAGRTCSVRSGSTRGDGTGLGFFAPLILLPSTSPASF